MNLFKKLTSVVLSGLMLATGLPSVLADTETPNCKNTINVAVLGDDDNARKEIIQHYAQFFNEYNGIRAYECTYKDASIRFFDIPSDPKDKKQKDWVDRFIKSRGFCSQKDVASYNIVCLNIENDFKDIVDRMTYWLDYIKGKNENHQIKILLYGAENDEKYGNKISDIGNALVRYEREFNDKFPDKEQFRDCHSFPGIKSKEDVLNSIIQGSNIFFSEKKNGSNCMTISLITIGSVVGIMLILASVAGIIYCVAKK